MCHFSLERKSTQNAHRTYTRGYYTCIPGYCKKDIDQFQGPHDQFNDKTQPSGVRRCFVTFPPGRLPSAATVAGRLVAKEGFPAAGKMKAREYKPLEPA